MSINIRPKYSHEISIITVTINRESLWDVYATVNRQTYGNWHHYVIGDGVLPIDDGHPQRSCIGFTRAIGAEEPGLNMPDGTPNPLLRWALQHLALGQFVCFLDDDNAYEANFLEKMRHSLVTHPETGIVLCPAQDNRYMLHQMDGYPEKNRCDNSAFMARADLARAVGFPKASRDQEVVQDYEFIKACAELAGWTRVDETLVIFGKHPNTPPLRGKTKIVFSWELPIRGVHHMKAGDYKSAIELLQQAVTIDEKDAWAKWHLGEALFHIGNRAEAIKEWQSWANLIDVEPRTPHDWVDYCRALVHIVQGESLEAKPHLLSAIERVTPRLDSTYTDVDDGYNYALYLLAAERRQEAIEHYQRMVQFTTPIADALNDLQLLKLVFPSLPSIDTAINIVAKK